MPDRVGGALKRRANDLVLHGKDIISAKYFAENFQDSAVSVYEVGQQEIDYKEIILSKETLKPVPGTLKRHQICYSGYGNILYIQRCELHLRERLISCRTRYESTFPY